MRVSTPPVSLKELLDFGIINEQDLESASNVKEFMNKKKENYVLTRHTNKIWQIEKGAKAGYYKTFISGKQLKQRHTSC